MTVELYVTLDGKDNRFDGRRAQHHLTHNLAMIPRRLNEAPEVATIFNYWLDRRSASVTVHPNGVTVISGLEGFAD
ncbi:MAG: hypothetical protein SAK29_36000 [Scytonema sp. PMC 1069.18]|nr:hypothetical protein [Scytonema sp. PMC 1069.18]MEC4880295.1 hypothetical protein [Scytonema sp. PMC 1070.18]